MTAPSVGARRRTSVRYHHDSDSAEFAVVQAEILRRAAPQAEDTGVDLGAGAGPLALPLAEMIKTVVAVECRQARLDELRSRAGARQLGNTLPITADLTELALPRASVDPVPPKPRGVATP